MVVLIIIAALTPGQPNILLDDLGHARIIDFGLSTISRNQGSMQSTTFQRGLTPRWSAPELLKDGDATKETDIFSFAMVMIEVCHRWCTVCGVLAY